jgi:uncharacterized repeat protein (TIGR03943 family)
MSRENHVAPIALTATLLLRLGLTDAHLNYVKPAMRPWLVVAGAVLAALTVVRYVGWRTHPTDDATTTRRPVPLPPPPPPASTPLAPAVGALPPPPPPDHGDDDGAGAGAGAGQAADHDHVHGRGLVPWLLALPFAAVILVGPAPLSSFAASRQDTRTPDPPAGDAGTYPPLPAPVDGAHELTLSEFAARAAFDDERQMEGQTIRLTGFVTPAEGGGSGFTLTRFRIACCAGDAYPIKVAIEGLDQPVPAVDTWLAVEGTWQPSTDGRDDEPPVLDATTLREVPQPADPYET